MKINRVPKIRHVVMPVVPHLIIGLRAHELVNQLEDMLQFAGFSAESRGLSIAKSTMMKAATTICMTMKFAQGGARPPYLPATARRCQDREDSH